MKTTKALRAFTLIEILIVIAILAVLVTFVFASVTHMYEHGNRLRRITDLRSIQSALAQYAASNNGTYPSSAGNGADWNTQCVIGAGYAGGNKSRDTVIPGLVPAYLSSMPADPEMNTTVPANGFAGSCCYLYKSDGKDYKVLDFNCSTAGYADPEFKSMDMVDPCRPGPYMPSFAIGVWTLGTRMCGATSPENGW